MNPKKLILEDFDSPLIIEPYTTYKKISLDLLLGADIPMKTTLNILKYKIGWTIMQRNTKRTCFVDSK